MPPSVSDGEHNKMIKAILNLAICVTCVVMLIFVAMIASILYTASNTGAQKGPTEFRMEDVPLEWQRNCQYMELNITGEEGELGGGMKLRGLAFLFRHGERSPIDADNLGPEGCLPPRKEDQKSFDDFVTVFKSADHQKFMQFDEKYDQKFSPIPERARCSDGQLTAEGQLQHLKLGAFMNERYASSNIFKDASKLDISIIATLRNRTFQSAVGFSSALLFPLKDSIQSVTIMQAQDHSTCTEEKCRCKDRRPVRNKMEEQHIAYFLNNSATNATMREEMLRLRAFSPYSSMKEPEPFQFIDVSLGRYLCRRKPLPCFDDGKQCVTFDLLENLHLFTSNRTKAMFDAGDQYVIHKMMLIEAYGVLSAVSQMIANLRNDTDTTALKIFSAHDSTLGPNLATLRIPFRDFPHYCSRLTFEVYEKGTDGKFFLRILYQGVDQTAVVGACQGKLVDGLCPAEVFEDYVNKGLFAEIGIQPGKLSEFCETEDWRRMGKPKN